MFSSPGSPPLLDRRRRRSPDPNAIVPVARLPSFTRPAAILPQDFFLIDALDLAPRLLGKFLRRDEVVLQITEVEAYRPDDTACHGRFGITSRTAPVVTANAPFAYNLLRLISQKLESRNSIEENTIQTQFGEGFLQCFVSCICLSLFSAFVYLCFMHLSKGLF